MGLDMIFQKCVREGSKEGTPKMDDKRARERTLYLIVVVW
jgi:hypothetical protein